MALLAPGRRALRACITASLLLVATASQAQWHDQNGNPLPEASWRGEDKGLAGQLLLADIAESNRFIEEWYSTPTEHAPNIQVTSEARRGDIVELLVAFVNCAPDTADRDALQRGEVPCTGTYDVVLRRPDGTPYAGSVSTGLELAGKGGMAAPLGVVQLSPSSIRVRFEPDDPLGEYRFEVRMHNPARGAELALSTTITVTDEAR